MKIITSYSWDNRRKDFMRPNYAEGKWYWCYLIKLVWKLAEIFDFLGLAMKLEFRFLKSVKNKR